MIEFVDNNRSLPISLDEDAPPPARIKVIGVGGGGGNAVNRMIEVGIRGVDFVAANTDLQALRRNKAGTKIQLGINTSRGLGAGADPNVAKNAALEDAEEIAKVVSGADMVFVAAGMGKGTGTGAGPVVAKIASESGALVVAIVTKPFETEGIKRMRIAEQGIAEMREYVDTLITIPNERLYTFVDRNLPIAKALEIADDVLRQAVQGISDLINETGFFNVDFADVKAVMENMGMALMGTGTASGENRAVEAAQRAIANPLLEEQSIQGARAILINVTGGDDLTMPEFYEACNIVKRAADEEANIIQGLVIKSEMRGEVKISVIATGFDAPASLAARRQVALAATPPAKADRKSRSVPEPVFPEDSGYGVNLMNVKDPKEDYFDIPTFLRRQMD